MDNPSFFHLLAYLYIGFAKLSNNEIPLEEEMAIKRKIAQWMDLSFRNVDQYELVMRQSLEWFNSNTEKPEEELLKVAEYLTQVDNVDDIILTRILSEIRDIAVSNGKFDQGEKVLHDKLAAKMGINVSTIDDHCGPLEEIPGKKPSVTQEKAGEEYTDGKIGFKYGSSKPKKNKKKNTPE